MKLFADLLKGIKIDNRPVPSATPKSERNKVVAIPTREPVNRQALRVLVKNTDWLAEPPKELQPLPSRATLDAMAARLKTEFNEHAATRDLLGTARAKIAVLRAENSRQACKIKLLEAKIAELQDVICQLEDLKL